MDGQRALILALGKARICRSFADVAQLVEHFTRKRVQRSSGTERRLAQQSRFAADSWIAASPVTWSSVIAFGPVSAPLAVSAQYGRRHGRSVVVGPGFGRCLRPPHARSALPRLRLAP